MAICPSTARPNATLTTAFVQEKHLSASCVGVLTNFDKTTEEPDGRTWMMEALRQADHGRIFELRLPSTTKDISERFAWFGCSLKPPSIADAALPAGVKQPKFFDVHNYQRLFFQRKRDINFFKTHNNYAALYNGGKWQLGSAAVIDCLVALVNPALIRTHLLVSHRLRVRMLVKCVCVPRRS
eukprot:4630079-Prymnesium_polylepis.1